jgi:hypothetical protein
MNYIDNFILNLYQNIIDWLSLIISPIKVIYILTMLFIISEVYHTYLIDAWCCWLVLIIIPLLLISGGISSYIRYLNSVTNEMNSIRENYEFERVLVLIFYSIDIMLFLITSNYDSNFLTQFVNIITDSTLVSIFYILSTTKPNLFNRNESFV